MAERHRSCANEEKPRCARYLRVRDFQYKKCSSRHETLCPSLLVQVSKCSSVLNIRDRSFFNREGGGLVGLGKHHLKSACPPPPPLPQLFLDEPPQKKTKKINSPSRFYLFFKIFFMIPLPDVIVINMKTKFSIPILQSTLFG